MYVYDVNCYYVFDVDVVDEIDVSERLRCWLWDDFFLWGIVKVDDIIK